jgi:phage terminase large subunit
MIEIEIPIEVFNPAYRPYINNTTRTQIFFGGSGSGKSVFLSQRCIYDLLRGGRNYLVCRAVGNTIRRSVFNEIRKVITDWNLNKLFSINKTDGIITCLNNGYQAIFVGLDDTEKVKSITPEKGVITDIWIEETTECEEKTIKDLYKRQRGGKSDTPKRLIMSFNPILQSHWIYLRYFSAINWEEGQTVYQGPALLILKTWYIHNLFLTEADVQDLESEKDSYYFNVYTLGNWGVLGNVIFTNWRVEDLTELREQFVNRRSGLDFGFSSDPAALSLSHYDRMRKTIYIFGELYEAGLTNDLLAEEILPLSGRDAVICDSAEPKSIAELRKYGVNAKPAAKGKDSVLFGIQWLQQQQIVIDKSCINARNEFQQYKWKEDKNGNAMRQPVEKNDHIIDATRYAYENDATARPKFTGQKIDFYAKREKTITTQPARSEQEIEELLRSAQ